ncbi:uncharacterized protein GGS25DRAFT_20207 [Hypoxylon fragiforme]|uniref:uncharacterized protein n=1 Tax=Hypoxylon fragiforme TaxID=63214 RepID=UPI0020C695A9|nr:uncharacterized protein GGS25DRAFT_20207 [Hypoxylon fragiforme]KAI2613848.1 hypothetical protein GGS25DRAFT_20207 [Hypoxylon fragiforme]
MRCSCLLLALVAGAAADGTTSPRRTHKNDLTSKSSREIPEALSWFYARVEDRKKAAGAALRSRENDSFEDDADFDDNLKDLELAQAELDDRDFHQHEEDDDDDDDDGPGPGPGDHGKGDGHDGNGKVIAGGVVGGFIALFLILCIWYFLRIRPKRKQRLADAARKEAELEQGYGPSPNSSAHPLSSFPSPAGPAAQNQHVRYAMPTPFPARAPSVQTESTMSGLALPTPALTYSPSVSSPGATPNMPAAQPREPGAETPPTYAVAVALQSTEPHPEASSYQMGQTPAPSEPPVYHLPVAAPGPGATDMKGQPISRY